METNVSTKKHFKYACVYTDGGMRTLNNVPGAGAGIHGYFYDELQSMRFAGVPNLVTVCGYKDKPTGNNLKDVKYNPTFTAYDVTQHFRVDDAPCKVIKDVTDFIVLDAWRGIINQPTNNRGEMQALIDLFRACPVSADKYYILADSMLVINGYNKDMDSWKRRGWIKGNGEQPKNLDLWLELDKIKTEFGDRVTLGYIKAHDGNFGNDCADRNATHGVCSAVNGDTVFHCNTVAFTDSNYWNPDKPIPPILRSKWCYGITGGARETITISDQVYYSYFCGDHSKDADDADLLGKEISDAGFSLVYTKQPVPIIDRVMKYHVDHMWEHDSTMYKSDVVNMINISNINTPKELWRLNNVNYESLMFESHRNDLISSDERLLSQMIRPPKLSYRALDIEYHLTQVMHSALHKLGYVDSNPRKVVTLKNLIINEVTEKFYSTVQNKNGKSTTTMTEFYDRVAKAVSLKINHPCGDSKVDVILTRGIDIPSRNNMNGLCGERPKVYIVTWKFSEISFMYATLIVTDESISLWEGHYSCRRDLDER